MPWQLAGTRRIEEGDRQSWQKFMRQSLPAGSIANQIRFIPDQYPPLFWSTVGFVAPVVTVDGDEITGESIPWIGAISLSEIHRYAPDYAYVPAAIFSSGKAFNVGAYFWLNDWVSPGELRWFTLT